MEHAHEWTEWLLGDEDVLYVIGGGGKTTLLRALARQAGVRGERMVLATSTKVLMREFDDMPVLVWSDDEEASLAKLETMSRQGPVFVCGGVWCEKKKYLGLAPERLEALRQALAARTRERVRLVVEADGARNRPLKVPFDHEPVLGPSGRVAVVAGAELLGETVFYDSVYNFEGMIRLLSRDGPFVLTPQDLARLVVDPAGYAKGIDDATRLRVVLNKAEDARVRMLALDAKHRLGARGVSARVVSLARGEEYGARVAALVLAAGASRRMGRPKQTLSCGDANFLERTLDLYRECTRRVVVLGANAQAVRAATDFRGASVVHNPDWEQGMASSLAAGIRALSQESVDGVWITFCDMPHLKRQTVHDLARCVETAPERIVVPWCDGRRGHPAYLPSALFPEMLGARGDVGARHVIAAHEDELVLCPVDDPAVYADLDDEQSYLETKRKEGWI